MIEPHKLRLRSLEYHTQPFPYFTATRGLGDPLSLRILEWLETDAPWTLAETSFYEQYELDLASAGGPPQVRLLNSRPFLTNLRRKMERIFGCNLSEQIDCTIHKLVVGQRIRLHNDFIPGQETHRVLIQLNRSWQIDHGGLLMLFNSSNVSDIHKVVPPIHDTIVGFAISEQSNHAVSTVHHGDRFTIVYSFYEKPAP